MRSALLRYKLLEFFSTLLEQVRRSLCLRPNLYRLATEKDKDELRAIIAALRRGDLPDVPPQRGIMNLFRLRR
jgi:hypothetical protein